MVEDKKKILKELISDGMITTYYSYKYTVKLPENMQDKTVGLTYLTQANTFFTAAKTLYYEHEELFPGKELQDVFFEFGKYNNELLKNIRRKDEDYSVVSYYFETLIKEIEWISCWLRVDLTKEFID